MKQRFDILLRAAFLAVFAALFFASSALALTNVKVEGVSFTSAYDEDLLVMELSEWRFPRVMRYGMTNRIVAEFTDTVAAPSLKSLVEGKRGNCVEKFEVQMFAREGDINVSGGIRAAISKTTTLLVAYVEKGCEVRLDVNGKDVVARYYRVGDIISQPRPTPVTEITDIMFSRRGDEEYVSFELNGPAAPAFAEETAPNRLIVTFPETHMNERVETRIRRFMERTANFSIEFMAIGTMPSPYDELDDSGEYHFVGVPSPLGNTMYQERSYGLQTSDSVITLFPGKGVKYRVIKRTGHVIEIAFKREREIKNNFCDPYTVTHPDEGIIYPVVDEEGREIEFDYE